LYEKRCLAARAAARHCHAFRRLFSVMNGTPVGGAYLSERTIGNVKSLMFSSLKASAIEGTNNSARKLINTSKSGAIFESRSYSPWNNICWCRMFSRMLWM
jgi:hypothetical protein